MLAREPANHLLRRVGAQAYRKLAGDLELVDLAFKEVLYESRQEIRCVYFPTTAVGSFLTLLEDGEQVETGTIGREGVVGISVFLGAPTAPGRAICQIEGQALRMRSDRFLAAVQQIERLRSVLLLYTNALMAMLAQSAACNRAHAVEARLARWLLMTHDRVDGPEFSLTQEFLGQMLGVRRPAVNIAGTTLQRAGMIKYARGKITILDRPGLERAACGCYEQIRGEFELGAGAPAGASRRAAWSLPAR